MKIFSIILALLAICELIGFATGHEHCIYPAILIGALSAFIWWQSIKDNFNTNHKPERSNAWYKLGKSSK